MSSFASFLNFSICAYYRKPNDFTDFVVSTDSGSLCPFEAKWTKTGYKSLQEWFPNSDKFLELYEGYLDAVYNSDYSYGFEEYHKMDFFICSIIMPPCLNVTEISSEEGEIRLVPPCRSLCSYAKPDNMSLLNFCNLEYT